MLKKSIESSIENLSKVLQDPELLKSVESAIQVLVSAILARKPVLVCGNGGSASDALHITGELVGKFNFDRPAMNVICLNSNVTVLTAWSNDKSFETVFSRQVEAHGSSGGVLWALSTSGNSPNVIEAVQEAKRQNMTTIVMTGFSSGKISGQADLLIASPGSDAPSAQNVHVVIYHFICQEVERRVTEKLGQ
jgi:D-sedoheptulose 7-phosphate isomerase